MSFIETLNSLAWKRGLGYVCFVASVFMQHAAGASKDRKSFVCFRLSKVQLQRIVGILVSEKQWLATMSTAL